MPHFRRNVNEPKSGNTFNQVSIHLLKESIFIKVSSSLTGWDSTKLLILWSKATETKLVKLENCCEVIFPHKSV